MTPALPFACAALFAAQSPAPDAAPVEDPPASVPFVVVEDDGTIASTSFDSNENANLVINAMLASYEATGAALPEVMSVWLAFPFNGNTVETRFIPIANDVTGIGLETAYGEGEEVFSLYPPLRAMLIHNDVTALPERAALERLPIEGFGEYLFLLELSHLWGPQIRVPPLDGGDAGDDVLIGFDFHWSFFLDGGGPAGGNDWIDNGDGTFTAPVFDAPTIAFSPLDLYLMGLAPAEEVPPFGVLENVVIPADAPPDPFTNRVVSAQSFPWQGPAPLTVTATRRALTIDDVIAQNGARAPAFGDAPTSLTLGTMLIVPAGLDAGTRDALVRDFVPLAADLAPSFARATGARASLAVLTSSPAPPPAVEPVPVDPESGDDAADDADDDGASGCAQAPASGALAALAASLVAAVPGRAARRRRR